MADINEVKVVRTSDIFNAADADVVIRSSDNVEFRLHKRNLEFTSGAFPPAETPVHSNETIQLTESAATLEILFQFVYPRQFPSLERLDFDSVMLLAEAGQKYEIFGLMNACQFQLRKFKHKHPDRILEFAAQHNHGDLVTQLVPILLHMPLTKLVKILPSHMYIPWSLYRESWLVQVMKSAAVLVPSHDCFPKEKTSAWSFFRKNLHDEIISDYLDILPGDSWDKLAAKYAHRQCCTSVIKAWRAELERIRDSMPPIELPSS